MNINQQNLSGKTVENGSIYIPMLFARRILEDPINY